MDEHDIYQCLDCGTVCTSATGCACGEPTAVLGTRETVAYLIAGVPGLEVLRHGHAGYMIDGGARFYGWAPDPSEEYPDRQRLHVSERKRGVNGHKIDKPVDAWFDDFHSAKDFVTAVNMAAPQSSNPPCRTCGGLADAFHATGLCPECEVNNGKR